MFYVIENWKVIASLKTKEEAILYITQQGVSNNKYIIAKYIESRWVEID